LMRTHHCSVYSRSRQQARYARLPITPETQLLPLGLFRSDFARELLHGFVPEGAVGLAQVVWSFKKSDFVPEEALNDRSQAIYCLEQVPSRIRPVGSGMIGSATPELATNVARAKNSARPSRG
jgi:hypothetical protein